MWISDQSSSSGLPVRSGIMSNSIVIRLHLNNTLSYHQ